MLPEHSEYSHINDYAGRRDIYICSGLLSFVVINTRNKTKQTKNKRTTTCGGKGLFGLYFRSQSFTERSHAGTKAETTEECYFWLAQLVFGYSPGPPPQSGLDTPTSVSNRGNAPETCSRARQRRKFLSWGSPSLVTLGCIKLMIWSAQYLSLINPFMSLIREKWTGVIGWHASQVDKSGRA